MKLLPGRHGRTLAAPDPITRVVVAGPSTRRRRSIGASVRLLAARGRRAGVMLGYPLYRLGVLSLQKFGLRQQFGQPAEWVGLDNYREILTDSYFWTVLGGP